MKYLDVFLYEWQHFKHSPFKIIAIVLFMLASSYGLFNGARLYQKQKAEVDKIEQVIEEEEAQNIAAYEDGKTKSKARFWIDFTDPYQAISFSTFYHNKTPSPAMVYSIGQAEMYGFIKELSYWASPYDADLAEEIANPERLQIGTLDFAFALLYLMPLLLLVLLYNIKSAETEQGFMPLIEVQSASKDRWLLARISFYVVLLIVVIFSLIFFGGFLTNITLLLKKAIWQMFFYSFIYLLLWSVLYFFILRKGTSISGNTLIMTGFFLLFVFIIPAAVHQYVSIVKPANLMTEFIDAEREQQQKIFELTEKEFREKLTKLFPIIPEELSTEEDLKFYLSRNQFGPALLNETKKESIEVIENENQEKNKLINSTFIFNPVSFFQNRFNSITETHYNNYQNYRTEIQDLVDAQIQLMVTDVWNEVKVDKERYMHYLNLLQQ